MGYNLIPLLFLVNTSSWMYDNRELIYNKSLYDITIPGTHDSGSYNLTGKTFIDIPNEYEGLIKIAEYLHIPIDKIIIQWTQTQTVDITQQLNYGSRYLDLRICYYNNQWYIHHNFIVGIPLINVLDQIEQFLIKEQGEIVIIELTHILNSSEKAIKLLNNTLYTKFKDFLYKTATYKNETIGKLVGQGQRLFIVSSADIYMYGNSIINTWANTYNTTQMIKYNDNVMNNWYTNKYKGLLKLSWVLTPTINTIIEGLFSDNSLTKLEKDLDSMLYTWMNNYLYKEIVKCPIFPNIIIVDFIEKSNITSYNLISLIKCNK